MVLVQISLFAGLHCKAPQYNKPTNLLYGGPVEAEVFTGRIKKNTQRSPDWLNRCFGSSKALVPWLHHTLQVKHEAEGGIAEEGSANRGCFLCSGCHPSPCTPSSRGLVVGRLGKAVLAYRVLRCSTTRSSWSGRTPVSQVFGECYFQ